MNDLLASIVDFLRNPVHITPVNKDWTYLIDVVGFDTILGVLWWTLCFWIRNGIDGSKAIARAIKHKKPLLLRKILIGKWKPLPFYDPIKYEKTVIKGL